MKIFDWLLAAALFISAPILDGRYAHSASVLSGENCTNGSNVFKVVPITSPVTFAVSVTGTTNNIQCQLLSATPSTSFVRVTSDGGTTWSFITIASLNITPPPPTPTLLPPPRCLPGDFIGNFHTTQSAAGDTIAVLWCNDVTGVGVNIIGGNLSNLTSAPATCLTAIEQFQWSVAWEVNAWNACSAQSVPTAAQTAAATAFAAHWVPHVTANGTVIINAQAVPIGTSSKGVSCSFNRMPKNASWFATTTGLAGFTQCTVQYPPTTGWP